MDNEKPFAVGDGFMCMCGCRGIGILTEIRGYGRQTRYNGIIRNPRGKWVNDTGFDDIRHHELTDAERADYTRAVLVGEVN